MTRGKFITFEGGEGAGKSTQVSRLVESLQRAGFDVVRTREPGGSPGAEEIRKLLLGGADERWDALTEALLVSAARRDHLLRVIRPALARGAWVVCDRFADSTLAYQGFAGGVPIEQLDLLYGIAVGDFAPDLTLVLDLPVKLGLARAASREGAADRFERRDAAFHERLRNGFLDIARREPVRCAVIDASVAVPAVHAAVLRAVRDRLGVVLAPA